MAVTFSLPGSGCGSAQGRTPPLGLLAAESQLPKTSLPGTGWAERCPGTPLLPSHCFLPLWGAVEGRKSAALPPFPAPGRSLAPILCTWVGLDEVSAPLLSSSGWRMAASMDGSALERELLAVLSGLDAGGLSCMWGEEGQSTCFSLSDKVLRITLALWEEKLQFFQCTPCCQKSLSISDHRLEMKAASLFFYLSFFGEAASGHLAPPCRRVGRSGGSRQEGTSPKRQSDLARGHTQEQEQLPRWPPEPH